MCVVTPDQLSELAVAANEIAAAPATPAPTLTDDDEGEARWAAARSARFGGVTDVIDKLSTHLRASLAAGPLWRYAARTPLQLLPEMSC